uniref:Uncharacterized protein n=1 Tax=Molossus molossus TaxID=27622 RepID=A0A7J8I7R3_MOLMO|nr:hypothetical protein HJG59_010493 [Molossus molossus]
MCSPRRIPSAGVYRCLTCAAVPGGSLGREPPSTQRAWGDAIGRRRDSPGPLSPPLPGDRVIPWSLRPSPRSIPFRPRPRPFPSRPRPACANVASLVPGPLPPRCPVQVGLGPAAGSAVSRRSLRAWAVSARTSPVNPVCRRSLPNLLWHSCVVFLRREGLTAAARRRKWGAVIPRVPVAYLAVTGRVCRRFQAGRGTAAPEGTRQAAPALAVAFQGHQKVVGSIPGRGDGGHG